MMMAMLQVIRIKIKIGCFFFKRCVFLPFISTVIDVFRIQCMYVRMYCTKLQQNWSCGLDMNQLRQVKRIYKLTFLHIAVAGATYNELLSKT